jgi:hypothetical protein
MLHAVLQRCGGLARYSFARLETPADRLAILTCIERRPSSTLKIIARGEIDSRPCSTATLGKLTTCFMVEIMFAIHLLDAGVSTMHCVSLTDNLGETKLNQHFVCPQRITQRMFQRSAKLSSNCV